MSIISIKNLDYTVGEQKILSNISFEINQGEYVALLGPNGGGKSTLIKLILGLLTPSSGDINILSTKQKEFKEYYKIGYVPQNVSLFDNNFPLSVYETVALGLSSQKSWFSFLTKEDKNEIDIILDRVDITNLKDKNLSQLSGGQRQRVMIARALVSRPQILILDEPSTGVDIASQEKFYQFLKRLNIEQKLTIIFITHDLGVIVDDVTNVLAVNQTLLFKGTAKEILSCESVSELYGTKSHIIGHHSHDTH
ncbi:Zinc ABC transporter, ATP-binding protein ZnuC [hydrothermal vent metagenome]|uniref:Zinc ABC transporter, ATP-binding protein ZnuC n=1 Tax=hydrothermal vent metagenome TaxID=652676 RepID=A0A1W1CEE7_9ZZZZ